VRSAVTDPPDVVYKDARFEVKEMISKGRRRHDEYRAAVEKARKATSLAALLEEETPCSISLDDLCSLVQESVLPLAAKYGPSKASALDLLFYINLTALYEVENLEQAVSIPFDSRGFRSVSLVWGAAAFPIVAASTAPSFLVEKLRKWQIREHA
jgi:hypothetical protein